MIFEQLALDFYELIDLFENEEIDYDSFKLEFSSFEKNTAISVGEKTFEFYANIKEDYIPLKKFNCNEGQISLRSNDW